MVNGKGEKVYKAMLVSTGLIGMMTFVWLDSLHLYFIWYTFTPFFQISSFSLKILVFTDKNITYWKQYMECMYEF